MFSRKLLTVLLSGFLAALLVNYSLVVREYVTRPASPRAMTRKILPMPALYDSLLVINGTFLGNGSRNYYGDSLPDRLEVVWRTLLGTGSTIVKKGVTEKWSGAGWTGQPLLVHYKDSLYILQGSYDHRLKKIEASEGNIVWEYAFDDILKGTGTIWIDPVATNPAEKIMIMQGSRLGWQNSLSSAEVYSFRAISFMEGTALWKMNVTRGPSWSRDVDASALVYGSIAYIGLENGYFTAFYPSVTKAENGNPKIIRQWPYFTDADRKAHGGELVLEASPCRLGNRIYVTTGSGHLYGYNLLTDSVDWDLYLGADMNGTPVVTGDSCLIITLEKQFIAGKGGAMKIDPSRLPEESVVWYFPTGDAEFSGWAGGIVGSAGINDAYVDDDDLHIAVLNCIDHYMYVIDHHAVAMGKWVTGPDGKMLYPTPKVLYKEKNGPSISTPILTGNRICAAGYHGVNLYAYTADGMITKLDAFKGTFEATPVTHEGKIYIASRDGYLYCFSGIDSYADLTN